MQSSNPHASPSLLELYPVYLMYLTSFHCTVLWGKEASSKQSFVRFVPSHRGFSRSSLPSRSGKWFRKEGIENIPARYGKSEHYHSQLPLVRGRTPQALEVERRGRRLHLCHYFGWWKQDFNKMYKSIFSSSGTSELLILRVLEWTSRLKNN